MEPLFVRETMMTDIPDMCTNQIYQICVQTRYTRYVYKPCRNVAPLLPSFALLQQTVNNNSTAAQCIAMALVSKTSLLVSDAVKMKVKVKFNGRTTMALVTSQRKGN